MNFYVLLASIISALTFICSIYYILNKYRKPSDLKKYDTIIIISLLLLSFSLFVLAHVLNYSFDLLEKSAKDYTKIGPYGDLIGGLINPVVAFIGIIAASLAFYAQYKANQQVQEQFSVQKFESQFYEMLGLHRGNLNEMIIEGYVFDYNITESSKKAKLDSKKEKLTSGKKVFVTMLIEFEAIYLICKKSFYNYHTSKEKLSDLDSFIGKQIIFDHAYYVFFNGVKYYSKHYKRYVNNDTTSLLSEELLEDYIKELKNKRDDHFIKGEKEYPDYIIKTDFKNGDFKSQKLWMSFNYKPFSGHQALLAHYYRHLFQTVKFVVKQDESLISYEEKRDYLRILRAILSNHEQILLYYNWLSGFGSKWEEKLEPSHFNKEYNKNTNKFFTDYRMIHNIPNDMVIDEFKLNNIFDEKYRDFRFEKDRKEFDTLFELLTIKSSKK